MPLQMQQDVRQFLSPCAMYVFQIEFCIYIEICLYTCVEICACTERLDMMYIYCAMHQCVSVNEYIMCDESAKLMGLGCNVWLLCNASVKANVCVLCNASVCISK